MIVLEVLKSFHRASAYQKAQDLIEEEDQQQGSGSAGQIYHSPSMENCVLAPYNFNFS